VPLIRVSHAARFNQAEKDKIMRDVTVAYAAAGGCDATKVWVILEQVEKTDWATGGASIASRAAPNPEG
jgi:4-oxalocrotonate tautomerase